MQAARLSALESSQLLDGNVSHFLVDVMSAGRGRCSISSTSW